MTSLLTSIYPSISFDLSYSNYLTFLQFSDKHVCEINSLSTLLPKWLGKRNKLTALDIGAGDGSLARTLFELYADTTEQFSLTLLEPALVASEKLQSDFAHDSRVEVVAHSLQDFIDTGQEARYDFILASHVCYYFEDRAELYEALCNLLAPGGVLCCIVGSISLIEHSLYQELMSQILQDISVERSFGFDGYGSCAEELQLISFCSNHLLSSVSVTTSTSYSPDQISQAAQALNSLATCMENDLCRSLGFLWRIPIDVVYRKRQLILNYFDKYSAYTEGIHIPSEDKIMFFQMPTN